MFVKTVSTTSGINPIKFDETSGVFYWILNTGSSTVYASTEESFSAGDDGVVSLGPKESRRLETNNDAIYILGEGQVEIHNQRDGICSFKEAPASSGGGETVDAYTKTESDARYAQKSDIPTKLPADGGNADTVNNHTVDADVPENAVFTDTVPDLSGYAMLSDIPSSLPANGGNADTVGGVGLQFLRQITQTAINTLPAVPNGEGDYLVNCSQSDTTFPYPYGHLSIRYGSYIDEYVAIFRTTGNDNKIYYNTYLTNHWSGWQEISATPIKSTKISGTTSNTGNVQLWATTDKKIPISAIMNDRYGYIFSSSNGFYYIGICHPDNHTMQIDETVSGTVYYIEKNTINVG